MPLEKQILPLFFFYLNLNSDYLFEMTSFHDCCFVLSNLFSTWQCCSCCSNNTSCVLWDTSFH